jgi:hypothetical protein
VIDVRSRAIVPVIACAVTARLAARAEPAALPVTDAVGAATETGIRVLWESISRGDHCHADRRERL